MHAPLPSSSPPTDESREKSREAGGGDDKTATTTATGGDWFFAPRKGPPLPSDPYENDGGEYEDDDDDDDGTQEISLNSGSDGSEDEGSFSTGGPPPPPPPSGGGGGGVHMVDVIDPDAVDFRPLLVSASGAAITATLNDFSDGGHDDDDDRLDDDPDGDWDVDRGRSVRGAASAVRACTRTALDVPRDAERRFRKLIVLPLLRRIAGGIDSASSSSSLASSLGVCASFFAAVVLTSALTSGFTSGMDPGDGGTVRRAGIGGSGGGGPSATTGGGLAAAGVALAPPEGTRIPRTLDVMADVDDTPLELMDTAVFWHVPRSGGTTMKHVMATCLGRVITSEVGGQEGHAMDERLEIIQKPYGNFVNVDTTTPLGIKRAKTLGLAPSRIADVVFTPYVHEATILFDPDHRGRLFTVLRDPVSRMQSLYYFRRMGGGLGDMTLEQFVMDTGENWMVRTLTNSMTGKLDVARLNVAKEILRRKFLVGLFDEKTETLRRIESYFGWKLPSPVARNCKDQLYYFEWHSRNEHPVLLTDDPLVLKIQRQNRYDMELYEYAVQLFREQEALFWGREGDGREGGGGADGTKAGAS